MLLKGNYTDGQLIGWKTGLAAGAQRIVRIRQLVEAPNEIYADQLDYDGTGALTAHALLGKEGIDTAIGAGTFVLLPNVFADTTAAFSLNATMPAGLAAKFNAGGTYRAKAGTGATVYTAESRQNAFFQQQQEQTVLTATAIAAAAAAKQQPAAVAENFAKRAWNRFDFWLWRLTGVQ